ncbi:Flp pilus assembly protein CpaB [Sphingomonas sp. NSE70-1]|uniref:Flp pilus assembly protein CpaB n=1 Tax=Sphingomonas caseinilyticus TaxID=2908205 RepID=A0ABT0RVC6_9SPHN|nr:Flp pilus assembly protein CpaB [Sphingomonas caseinilyticus]MCL6698906.1 Flp pilus assembly protein CpaB [Sphingomonas caseinilyticus]
MKRQTIIALGVAIILGLVAVFVANAYISGRERQMEAATPTMTRIAVASLPLAYGTEVTPDKVKFVPYPAASLPPGTYKTIAELLPQGKRRVALRPIQPNQPLLATDLSGEGQNASIAALLPDGMRAATVRINDVSGVAGFVKPNDTVDVLITRQPLTPDGSGQQVTDVLLQNVRVIAMGSDAVGADGQPSPTNSTTLEVTPVDAQKLVLGQQLGQLSLALRKPGVEQNIPVVETVSLNDLRYELYGAKPAAAPSPERKAQVARLTQPRRAPPVRRAVAPAPPSTNTISVTRGVETKDYEVGGYAQ